MAETNPVPSNLAETIASAMSRSKTTVQAMLSQERAQKLDLLIHLITNLQQSLVLCGPEGIGKTTLLENLIARKLDSWIIYPTNVTPSLSFEELQAGLLRHLQNTDSEFGDQSLDQILSALAQQKRSVVFILDDAGLLIPGLINSLCQFASNYTALRVIFVLTSDELHIKNSSDKDSDNCHFIDVPPLDEKQTGDFLKNLSSSPDSVIDVTQVSSAMINKIYRETHGIPGRIVTMQKIQTNVSKTDPKQWLYIGAAAGVVIAVLISSFLWSDDPVKPELQAQAMPIEQDLAQASADKKIPAEFSELEKQAMSISDQAAMSPISPEVVDVEIMPPVVNEEAGLDEAINESIDLAENDFNLSEADPIDLKALQVAPANLEQTKQNNAKIQIDESFRQNQQAEKEPTEPLKNSNENKSLEGGGSQKIAAAKLVTPEIPEQITASAPEIKNKPEQQSKRVVPPEEKKPVLKTESKPVPEQAKPETKAPALIKKVETKKAIVDKKQRPSQGVQWVLNQKAGNYSLQLMAIAKQRKSALTKIINKHPDLQDKLHYFPSVKKGEEKFVLLYGSFSKLDEAKQAIKKLPKDFGKPWLRRFKMLHKEIKSN